MKIRESAYEPTLLFFALRGMDQPQKKTAPNEQTNRHDHQQEEALAQTTVSGNQVAENSHEQDEQNDQQQQIKDDLPEKS